MRHFRRAALVLSALCAAFATSALGQDDSLARPQRALETVALPKADAALLRLGSTAPLRRYGAIYDRIGGGAALPVLAPGVSLQIRAAADRARVFLAWTQYDLDGDGAVARGEFDRHAQMSWGESLGARERALLDGEWASADADQNGFVSLGEIHALALEMAPVPDTGPLGPEGKAMLGMDLDNDGFVVWDEVEAVLRARLP
ncbi:MAG TPA: hypothetical protein ENK80_05195 [Rhodobacterales bacterium]|nr:hypothetical protein [Rhodobacterales bacterium]